MPPYQRRDQRHPDIELPLNCERPSMQQGLGLSGHCEVAIISIESEIGEGHQGVACLPQMSQILAGQGDEPTDNGR